MSDVTVQVVGVDQVVLHLKQLGEQARAALLRAVTEEAIAVQMRTREKLAGEVLQERTHHLHDSIHFEIKESATGIVGTVGTDVVYAAYQEYGFSGAEQVRAHLRRMTMAFGRPIEPVEAQVQAHTRQVRYPAHSFLRSALAEKEAEIRAALEAAVSQAVRGAQA